MFKKMMIVVLILTLVSGFSASAFAGGGYSDTDSVAPVSITLTTQGNYVDAEIYLPNGTMGEIVDRSYLWALFEPFSQVLTQGDVIKTYDPLASNVLKVWYQSYQVLRVDLPSSYQAQLTSLTIVCTTECENYYDTQFYEGGSSFTVTLKQGDTLWITTNERMMIKQTSPPHIPVLYYPV